MRRNQKSIRVAIAALLAGVLLLCALCIVAEGHHHCSGDECAICACLRLCERVLHPQADPGAALVAATAAAPAFVLGAVLFFGLLAAKASPISNKVRLND